MKKKYLLIFVLMITIFTTACSKNDFKFEKDDSLSVYTENEDVLENISENAFGATGAKLSYLNDDYAVISHHEGILIYEFESKEVFGTIDTKAMYLNKIQGYPHTIIVGYKDYIAIYNDEAKNAYIYSIVEDTLMKVDLESLPKDFSSTEDTENLKASDFTGYKDSYTDTYHYDEKLYVLRQVYDTNKMSIEVLDGKTKELEKEYIIYD